MRLVLPLLSNGEEEQTRYVTAASRKLLVPLREEAEEEASPPVRSPRETTAEGERGESGVADAGIPGALHSVG